MTGVFLILLAIITIFIVFLIFQSIGGKLVGAKIEEIAVFNGPELIGFNIGGIRFKINFLPLGSYVKFAEGFLDLRILKRIFIVLAGLAAYLVLAIIGVGFEETTRQFLSGFRQIFQGVISPFAVGSTLIELLANVLKQQSFIAGTGILAAKFLAFNIIPIGSLAGGMLLIYLFELFGFKSEKFNEKFQLIGFLILLVIFIAWTVGFIGFIWKSIGN